MDDHSFCFICLSRSVWLFLLVVQKHGLSNKNLGVSIVAEFKQFAIVGGMPQENFYSHPSFNYPPDNSEPCFRETLVIKLPWRPQPHVNAYLHVTNLVHLVLHDTISLSFSFFLELVRGCTWSGRECVCDPSRVGFRRDQRNQMYGTWWAIVILTYSILWWISSSSVSSMIIYCM